MGRNTKVGLNYFPLDTDFFDDEKILFTVSRFGLKCEGIIIRLMCRIYRNGYFLEFNEDMALLIARSVGDVSLHGLVMDIVNELVKRGFFDKSMFDSFSILTSTGFQKRYIKACVDSHRINININPDYDLILFNAEEITKSTEEITNTRQETPFPHPKESKVKENKINKSKVKKINTPASGVDFINQILDLFLIEFKNSKGDDFIITDKGKERSSIGKLLGHYKKQNPEKDSSQTLTDFQTLLSSQ